MSNVKVGNYYLCPTYNIICRIDSQLDSGDFLYSSKYKNVVGDKFDHDDVDPASWFETLQPCDEHGNLLEDCEGWRYFLSRPSGEYIRRIMDGQKTSNRMKVSDTYKGWHQGGARGITQLQDTTCYKEITESEAFERLGIKSPHTADTVDIPGKLESAKLNISGGLVAGTTLVYTDSLPDEDTGDVVTDKNSAMIERDREKGFVFSKHYYRRRVCDDYTWSVCEKWKKQSEQRQKYNALVTLPQQFDPVSGKVLLK